MLMWSPSTHRRQQILKFEVPPLESRNAGLEHHATTGIVGDGDHPLTRTVGASRKWYGARTFAVFGPIARTNDATFNVENPLVMYRSWAGIS